MRRLPTTKAEAHAEHRAGFQSLKTLIPTQMERSSARWASVPEGLPGGGGGLEGRLVRHQQLGSLTRPSCPQAAILQQTAEYIFSLEQEKTRLCSQDTQLRRRFIQVALCPPPVPSPWAWARAWAQPLA